MIALVWGTTHVFLWRQPSFVQNMFGFGDPQPLELPKDDNLWGFGQCITVILLTLPFLSMCNNYFGKL